MLDVESERCLVEDLLDLKTTVDNALERVDVFGSVDHNQGLAQHSLSDIQRKLNKLVDTYLERVVLPENIA